MGFWSSVGSALSSFCSSVSNALGSFASAFGGSLGAICMSLSPMVGLVISALGTLVSEVAKALGLIKPEEDIDELGLKAELSDKKPEDYDLYSDYIDALKEETLSSEDKLKLDSKEDRAKYRVIGTGILMQGVSEKIGINIPLDFWIGASKSGLNAIEIKTTLENIGKMGGTANLDSYFKGTLSSSNMSSLDKTLEETFKSLNSKITNKEMDNKFEQMSNNYKNFKIEDEI